MSRFPVFATAPTTGTVRCAALDLAAAAALFSLLPDRRKSRTAIRTATPMPTTQSHRRCVFSTGGALGASMTFGASSSGTSASLRGIGASVLLIETILPPGPSALSGLRKIPVGGYGHAPDAPPAIRGSKSNLPGAEIRRFRLTTGRLPGSVNRDSKLARERANPFLFLFEQRQRVPDPRLELDFLTHPGLRVKIGDVRIPVPESPLDVDAI